MNYYDNVASPMNKKNLDDAIKALENADEKIDIKPQPEFCLIPPDETIKQFNLDKAKIQQEIDKITGCSDERYNRSLDNQHLTILPKLFK